MARKFPNLTPEQLQVELPPEAIACLNAAKQAEKTAFDKVAEGTQITLDHHLAQNNLSWGLLGEKGQKRLIKEVFVKVRVILKVGEPEGMKQNTFGNYSSTISKQIRFSVPRAAAEYPDKALKEARTRAESLTQGTFAERMIQAIQLCQSDPSWSGHSPNTRQERTVKTPPPAPVHEILMPIPARADSVRQLAFQTADAIARASEQPGIERLRDSDDLDSRAVFDLLLKARAVRARFTEFTDQPRIAIA